MLLERCLKKDLSLSLVVKKEKSTSNNREVRLKRGALAGLEMRCGQQILDARVGEGSARMKPWGDDR